ncbi:VOC family protein [Paenibacillus sp. 19GGS1-52]|uniref:VOC family protein n=1 Tax=Paenibacillus sp. 19GGS1-52 TaxID=2758563 RepID=UPI001EFB2CFF|nr:VOC family protein [Paenibacillus sp. 19GGS1-52]
MKNVHSAVKGGARYKTTHAGTEMGSVQLKISNMEESVEFYTRVIGLEVLNRYHGLVRLTADGIHPLIVLEEIADAIIMPEQSCAGLYHFALLVPTRRDLGLVLRHLLDLNVQPGSADHDVSEALYLSDQDGNGIEIYWDRPKEDWTMLSSGEIHMSAEPLNLHSLLGEAGGETWSGMASGTKMGHVHLHVRNVVESEAFYSRLLGFQPTLHYGPSAVFISAGGYHHHLGLNIWAGANAPSPPENAVGLSHYTIVNPDPGHIEEIINELEKQDIAVDTRGDGWYFHDLNGIQVRLTTCPIL